MKTDVIVALDYPDLDSVQRLLDVLDDRVGWFKVGKQLFTRYGPAAIKLLQDRGKRIFLDLKFHDIPNTVAEAVAVAADLGVDMVNVHASGGHQMMAAAVAKGKQVNPELLMIAVTVLTSLDDDACLAIGYGHPIEAQVIRLAKLAEEAGMDGVVASAHEIAPIQAACGLEFLQVIPGIRPANAAMNDQKRSMTPAAATKAGAHYLVMGRPITQAPNPAAAAQQVLAEINEAT